MAMPFEKIFCISVYRYRFAAFIGRSDSFSLNSSTQHHKNPENPPVIRLVVSLPASSGLVESTKQLAIADRLVYSA
jgi:hypothetical protein